MKIISKDKDRYILRIDPDEEVLSVLSDFCHANKIEAATFNAIGAAKEIIISYFDLAQKKYLDQSFNENLEIISLIGNVSLLGGKPLIHVHGSFSDAKMQVKAGHVKKAVVSVTGEVALQAYKGKTERRLDERFGLNLLE
jgi:predicted DNA-binding protein with PD1-like motif